MMPTTTHEIGPAIRVSDPQTLAEIYRFRVQVWKATGTLADRAFADGQWQDAHDPTAMHWVIRGGDGRILGAARLTLHQHLSEVDDAEDYLHYGLELPPPIAAPARVVVCPSARGQGLGGKLLQAQDEAAIAAGCRFAVRQASPAMVSLLKKRGWQILGPAHRDPRFAGTVFQVALREYR